RKACMYADDIGLPAKRVKVCIFDVVFLREFFVWFYIVPKYPATKAMYYLNEYAADAAGADYAYCLIIEIKTNEVIHFKIIMMYLVVCNNQLSVQGEHQCQ